MVKHDALTRSRYLFTILSRRMVYHLDLSFSLCSFRLRNSSAYISLPRPLFRSPCMSFLCLLILQRGVRAFVTRQHLRCFLEHFAAFSLPSPLCHGHHFRFSQYVSGGVCIWASDPFYLHDLSSLVDYPSLFLFLTKEASGLNLLAQKLASIPLWGKEFVQ